VKLPENDGATSEKFPKMGISLVRQAALQISRRRGRSVALAGLVDFRLSPERDVTSESSFWTNLLGRFKTPVIDRCSRGSLAGGLFAKSDDLREGVAL
jgi:hypothetical protein